jgi:hypothetical protein
MRTPTATIGIRGGVMLIDLAEDGKLSVYKVYGNAVTITGLNGVSQTITRNGFAVTGVEAGRLAQLDGRAGGSGGASTVPTEVTVANHRYRQRDFSECHGQHPGRRAHLSRRRNSPRTLAP